MGAIVDYSFYTDTYKGTEADQASFPSLCAHASRVIGAMTRWQVDEDTIERFPHFTQTLYRLAICSQIDFLAFNGVETMSAGESDGFTVGKVRVDAKAASSAGGAMSASVSPAAMLYLEQTGLLYPGVPVLEGYPC